MQEIYAAIERLQEHARWLREGPESGDPPYTFFDAEYQDDIATVCAAAGALSS
jgi:hypothetical protein